VYCILGTDGVLYERLIKGHRISAKVGERYDIYCRYWVLVGYKLQRILLQTPDPFGYNNRFTANGCLHLYPNVEDSERLSLPRPTPRQTMGYRAIEG
jgi:hypothetical protein